MNFLEDLKFGEKYEKLFLNYVEYDEYKKPQGKFKYYDLGIIKGDKKTFYEIKADRLIHKTDNIAIEFSCNNKPSGISVSTADYWGIFEIIENGHELYIIPINEIKLIINTKTIKICKGGDNFNSKMYLIKKEYFENYKINLKK